MTAREGQAKNRPGPKPEIFKVELPFDVAVKKALGTKASDLAKPEPRRTVRLEK